MESGSRTGSRRGPQGSALPIILAITNPADETGTSKTVAVAPITHSPPPDPDVTVEVPTRVKEHLGLDSERSWVILSELNVFTWPGFDLRTAKGQEGRIDYGFLPPKLFERLIDKFSKLDRQGKVNSTSRDHDT